MQRTLKRELKVPEIVKREAIVDVIAWVGFSDLPGVIQSPFFSSLGPILDLFIGVVEVYRKLYISVWPSWIREKKVVETSGFITMPMSVTLI